MIELFYLCYKISKWWRHRLQHSLPGKEQKRNMFVMWRVKPENSFWKYPRRTTFLEVGEQANLRLKQRHCFIFKSFQGKKLCGAFRGWTGLKRPSNLWKTRNRFCHSSDYAVVSVGFDCFKGRAKLTCFRRLNERAYFPQKPISQSVKFAGNVQKASCIETFFIKAFIVSS